MIETISFLPSTSLFSTFCVASLALILTPGADMTFCISNGASGGIRAGLTSASGAFVSILAHILFAVLGLSAIIATSQTAFSILKWLGAAYLIYLAVQFLKSKPESTAIINSQPGGFKKIFCDAMMINLLNPKIGIFFLAFLPQFIDGQGISATVQIVTLGIVFNIAGWFVNAGAGIAGALTAQHVKRWTWFGRLARWLASGIMGTLGIRLLLSKNQ